MFLTILYKSFRKKKCNKLTTCTFYLFFVITGSTTFGFLNGATFLVKNTTGLLPDTTSYDYDAPITEYGNYTTKYFAIKEVIAKHNKIKTKPVSPPLVKLPQTYPSVIPTGQILLASAISQVKEKYSSKEVVSMEKFNIHNGYGQNFGYIVYRKTGLTISANAVLKISGNIKDTILVLVNGKLISPAPKSAEDLEGFGFWKLFNSTITLSETSIENFTLDLIVENFGRHSGARIFFKGLTDPVYINEEKISNWQIVPLEFSKSWNNALSGWKTVTDRLKTSALYKFSLDIDSPEDTFLDMRKWSKGIVIVNGFVLGRYFFVGPQQTLYLPAPLLKKGQNDFIIFEHYNAAETLEFSNVPIFETK